MHVHSVLTVIATLAVAPAVGFQIALQPGQPGRAEAWLGRSLIQHARLPPHTGLAEGLKRPSLKIFTPTIVTLRATVASGLPPAAATQSLLASPCPKNGVALVVFTGVGDLRVHDHGGLAAAASADTIHCVAILDPALLATMPDRRIRTLVTAVQDVGVSLSQVGINLEVRVGDSREESAAILSATQASHVYVHADPESSAQLMLKQIASGVVDSGRQAQVQTWNSALRAGELGASDDFQKYQSDLSKAGVKLNAKDPSLPLLQARHRASASAVFALPANLVHDLLAQVKDLRGDAHEHAYAERAQSGGNIGDRQELSETLALKLWGQYQELGEHAFARMEASPNETSPSLEHIAARVYGPEGYAHGEPFLRVFSEALALGCLSARQVWHDSNEALWGKGPAPFLVANEEQRSMHIAREAVEAREWHRILATRDIALDATRDDASEFEYKYWRWKGFLVRYAASSRSSKGAEQGAAGAVRPALVLVHGFGASADQWHRMMHDLRDDYDVWALDLLGFGHSEKPTIGYTQFLWEDVVRDFVLECVRRPCVLAGNSIGGYTALCAAVSLKDLCRGLVLCNSAGRMLTKAEWEREKATLYGGRGLRAHMLEEGLPAKPVPPNWVLDLFGRFIITALRPNVEKVCRAVYPDNPQAVDARLVANIVRDSKDPGGYSVVAAGAKLPTPITKNELLHEFGKPLLVAQGLNDPLGGGIAKARYNLYKEAHPDASKVHLVGLQAGHCPHHEAAHDVADEVRAFMSRLEASTAAGDARIDLVG